MAELKGVELLERGEILAEIDTLVHAACGGSGGGIVIEAAPGIGKTALVAAVASRATAAGVAVISASGAELERDMAYGVARELFAPVVRREGTDETFWTGAVGVARRVLDPGAGVSGQAPLDRFAAWHGLTWLCVSLSERQPLAVVVDDLQWADESSRLWLAYLARRVSELRVLLVLGSRNQAGVEPLLSELRSTPGFISRELGPLSEDSSALMVRRAVGSDVPADVCRACWAATGGNPFYLQELVGDGGATLMSSGASAVDQMAPAAVIGAVLARLRAAGPHAVDFARAVAVLGARVRLRQAAAVAELDPGHAEGLADHLCGACILRKARPLEFFHPIVRTAVYEELSDGLRSRLHHRAARTLADDGADPAHIAVQLLAAEPHGDPWVVERLRDAARGARAQGEPKSEVAYLSRALEEPPEESIRGDVLFELGVAERQLFLPAAETHLRCALQLTTQTRHRAQIVTELMPILVQPDRLHEVQQTVAQILPEALADAPDLAAILVANRIGLSSLHLAIAPGEPEGAQQLLGRLDPLELPARLLRCALAWQAALVGRPVSEVGPLLDGALTDIRTQIAQVDNFTGVAALIAATLCERFALAEQVCDAALEQCARRGSVFGSVAIWSVRSGLVFRLGRLRSAEADARHALDALGAFPLISPVAMLIDVLIERGEVQEALDLLHGTGYDGDLPKNVFSLLFLLRRIRLRVAAGELQAALDDVQLAEGMVTRAGLERSAFIGWRADGAVAHAAAGDGERARSLADEQVRLARAVGAPGALGTALRAAGIAHGREHGDKLLADSVEILAKTPMRLEHAKSLAAFGAAQRRAGQRIEARATLAQALDLADRCGARIVADHARIELRIAGARPRRTRRFGRDALTATELRTATLAASGMTNNQIAQSLFVTAKTVERHLTNTYVKLSIGSRHELADALAEPVATS